MTMTLFHVLGYVLAIAIAVAVVIAILHSGAAWVWRKPGVLRLAKQKSY